MCEQHQDSSPVVPLSDLAVQIAAEHRAVTESAAQSVHHALNAGWLLQQARSRLKHGQWSPWLAQHCPMAPRTAQMYMSLAKRWESFDDETRNAVADLSLRRLLQRLGNPRGVKSQQKDERHDHAIDVLKEHFGTTCRRETERRAVEYVFDELQRRRLGSAA